MKKIIFIILLLFLLCFFNYNYVLSQSTTFKKVFPGFNVDPYGDWNTLCKPYNYGSSFLITGSGSGIKLIKIDYAGNIISSKGFLSMAGFINNIIGNDNKIIISLSQGYYKNIYILDTSLNYLSSKRFDSLNVGITSTDISILKSTFDQGCIMSSCVNKLYAGIIKCDSNLDVNWSNYYFPIDGQVQDIIQTRDSGFAIAVNFKIAAASIIKTDKVGNVIWSKSYFRPRGYIHNVLENPDGSLIITGNTDSLHSGTLISPLFFVKLDVYGDVIWAKTFGDNNNNIMNYRSDTKNTHDGGYITLATQANPIPNEDLILIKLDANGDTLWVRAHGSPQSWDFGQNIEQLNDKGFIIAGITNNNIPVPLSSLYIIRTDSLGHTDSLCEEYNPSIAVNNISVNDSNITITSVPFNVHLSLPDSINAFYTTYAYDGCYLNDIPELYLEQTNPLLIYPNPSDGKFTIETNMNIPVKISIEIYDINSRKVYSGTTTESSIAINLSGHSKGLYFVKLSNERWVKTGKVMVE